MDVSISTKRWCLVAAGVLLGSALIPAALAADEPTDFTVDDAARRSVIEEAAKALNEGYVFPDVAKKMERAIRERLRNKEYDDITSANTFAEALTKHLRAVSHDLHIVIDPSIDPIPQRVDAVETPQDREKRRARRLQEGRSINFGFRKVERLSGNIGYLNMSIFYPVEFGGETAAAAMAFLSNTDALIIDLRENDGGHPDMVAFLTSYLLDGPVQLTGIFWRKDNRIQESWTLPYVPGSKYTGKSLYVLTSKEGTVSAAEAFVYNLRILKRATVIGETTAGAANPGTMARLTDHFTMFVPTGRAVNPITKSNWEGVGIKPDIEAPASTALKVAHVEALKKLAEASADEGEKRDLRRLIEAREKAQP